MAGRPVPRRVGGGLTGLHYAMITFVFTTVASLGAFVWQLTIVKGFETKAQQARSQLDFFGNPPEYYRNEATNRGNTRVFAVMDEDRKALAKLVTGQPEAFARTVESDATQLLKVIDQNHPKSINPGDTLLTVLRRLDQALTKAKRDASNRADQLAKLQADHQALTESIKTVQDDFQAQVAAINDSMQKLQARVASYQEEKDEQLAGIQASADKSAEEANALRQKFLRDKRGLEVERDRLVNQVRALEESVKELKDPGIDPSKILTKADGKVSRAIPGSQVVYINLGREDNVKIGMGFEVYSTSREPGASLRGKASLEVVSTEETTAECRVTRVEPGRPIIEGDIIVNISYERGRKPKFVVAGAFDLNYDGAEDPDGGERIRAMIRDWGGQVVDALDETTEFVVVGAPPGVPEVAPDATRVVSDQVRARQEEVAGYRQLVTDAKSLFIPVITQSQFLYLMGYAGN